MSAAPTLKSASASAPLIYSKMVAVMRDIGAVDKGRKNMQQNYQFRGIDDMYNELHPHLAKHGVFCLPTVLEERTEDRTTSKGSALIYRVMKIRYDFYAEDGSSVSAVVIGEGMDSGDKASNKAMSVAQKYTFVQGFAIPTEDLKDPEIDSHDVAPKPQLDPTKVYADTNPQRPVLGGHARKYGIDTANIPVMTKLSAACLGVPLERLELAVKKWVEEHQK